MQAIQYNTQTSLFSPVDYKTGFVEPNALVFNSFDEAVDYYFHAYRELGYPHYDVSQYDPALELQALIDTDSEDIIIDGVAIQSMTGCGFLWCFFPHWVDVSTFNDKSLADNWNDDAKLRTMMQKVVSWCLKHEGGNVPTNRIRQLAKVYLCKQSPSNFRPTVAKAIYDLYGDNGAVYDPCAGWEGRMFGFIASNCKEYVCCDPSTKTYNGLLRLRDTFPLGGKRIEVNNCCQEDYSPQKNHFDLVFTSPPYFDCERYSNEPTQSYIRYPTAQKWCDGFLKPLIQKAHEALKQNGTFILNIANVKNADCLEEQSVTLAEANGFKLTDTIKLTLSSISGNGVKYEPMFVFKKESE